MRSIVRINSFEVFHILIFIVLLFFSWSLIFGLQLSCLFLWDFLGFLDTRLVFTIRLSFSSCFLLGLLEALSLCNSLGFGS